MEWKWHLRRAESPLEPTTVEETVDTLRLFPIVGPDLCYPVAALLARARPVAFPLLIGVGLLFFDGSSKLGWVLTVLGALVILLGILTNLTIFFRPTSLFNTIIILVLLAGGLGLIARSLRAKA